MSNNEEEVFLDPEVEHKSTRPDQMVICVCVDCQSIQNAESVTTSFWYKAGQLPPCGCGGRTIEIPEDQYKLFVQNCDNGKRYL